MNSTINVKAPRASLLRRAAAAARGIERRMWVAGLRRAIGERWPGCPWRERQETAEAVWETPQNAEALFILLRWQWG